MMSPQEKIRASLEHKCKRCQSRDRATNEEFCTPCRLELDQQWRKQREQRKTSMSNDTQPLSEETRELQRDASKLAYTAIRFSGLYRELTSNEWDALADKLGALAVKTIQDEINVELTRREAESQEMDAWLSTGGCR